jgi:chaperone required for assembly of F1-ATPase
MNTKSDAPERPRRFWKIAEAGPQDSDGFPVLLDGRAIRTPQGSPLRLPTAALAARLAAEWDAVGETIDYAALPATRLAYTALDRVAAARDAVADEVARFAGADLLCYLAEGPASLVARQAELWTPCRLRAEAELGVSFILAQGIVHQAQPPETLDRVRAWAAGLDDFALAGAAAAAALYGSAILAFGLARGWLDGEAAFDLSRLDEAFQQDRWGVDAEAAARTEGQRREAVRLGRWFAALRADGAQIAV